MYVRDFKYRVNSNYTYHDYVAPGGGRLTKSCIGYDTNLDYISNFPRFGYGYDEIYNMVEEEKMSYAIPVFIIIIVLYAMGKRASVYEGFTEGAKNGVNTLFNIFPSMLAIMVGVAMLRESGALEAVMKFIAPVPSSLGINDDVMLLGIVRPLSGSGALGILGDVLKNNGADSFSGMAASVIMGSTETTFYTLMVYFSKTKVKYTKRVIPAAVFGDIVGLLASIWVCKIFF